MQGDFSRDSFDLQRVFSRVLSQQGRVALDADWNEMQAIQLRLLRGLAADLIGPHGGHGFRVDQVGENDFGVQPGRYYVDGWLCENPAAVSYAGGLDRPAQPFWPVDEGEALLKGTRYLVYLDVWERHLAWPETDGALELQRRTPTAVREMALDGLDTASRAQLTWQLRVLDQWVDKSGKPVPLPSLGSEADWRKWIGENWPALVNLWQPMARGQLVASHDGGTFGFSASLWVDAAGRRTAAVLANAQVPVGDIALHVLEPSVPPRNLAQEASAKQREAASVEASALSVLPGTYVLTPQFAVTVRLRAGRLHAQATGQGEFELFALDARRFFARVTALEIHFEGESGVPPAFVLHQGGQQLRFVRRAATEHNPDDLAPR